MVDWDRVEELRSSGWDWDRIADDPKVGFHADSSVREPARALRGLYHRQRSRQRRHGEAPAAAPSKEDREKAERKWTLPRVGYLLVPALAIWFTLAYVAPSPVGIILPALPYLALGLVVAVFLLLFGLFRSSGARWTKTYRKTVVVGAVLGLMITGVIALGGVLFFGCPYLPPSSSGTQQSAPGWISVNAAPWHEGGHPVLYFYGATWCPYCSASSWAIWKALSGFGTVGPVSFLYSAEGNVPEVDLADAQVTSSTPTVTFVPVVDTSGVSQTFPGTTNCIEQAYNSAYSGGAIPFVVINGVYVHAGTSLVSPSSVSSYTTAEMQQGVGSATGTPWAVVQGQTWWMMAFISKSAGCTPGNLAQQPYYTGWGNTAVWGSSTQSSVASDLSQIH